VIWQFSSSANNKALTVGEFTKQKDKKRMNVETGNLLLDKVTRKLGSEIRILRRESNQRLLPQLRENFR